MTTAHEPGAIPGTQLELREDDGWLDALRELREIRAEQRAQRAALDALVARLAPGPRDQGDAYLLGIIVRSTEGRTFTSQALWRHRPTNPALSKALASCDIESPRQLGKLLRRIEGRDVNSVRIVCVGMHRDGKVWQARVRE